MVQSLEAANRCTYAVTFGNFHGDNYNQAIHVANAVARIKALHPGVARVDVVAWSKGVLAVDAYLANASTWTGFSTTRFFERLAKEQAVRGAALPRRHPRATSRSPARTRGSISTSATRSTRSPSRAPRPTRRSAAGRCPGPTSRRSSA